MTASQHTFFSIHSTWDWRPWEFIYHSDLYNPQPCPSAEHTDGCHHDSWAISQDRHAVGPTISVTQRPCQKLFSLPTQRFRLASICRIAGVSVSRSFLHHFAPINVSHIPHKQQSKRILATPITDHSQPRTHFSYNPNFVKWRLIVTPATKCLSALMYQVSRHLDICLFEVQNIPAFEDSVAKLWDDTIFNGQNRCLRDV